ncbi:hypothetical protein BURK2_02440 [Burkholderiales bacterium]|nr:MAG: DUF2269 domain-containing protein [Burkholderiales bacterium]CAG0991983.1 hypothetical protein BURK2_02440 [Burkholderiales bacterium]
MTTLLFLKWLHILSATVLFGTGMGTAFALWAAHRRGDACGIALVARNVATADWVFTTPTVVLQPLTGVALALTYGWPLSTFWIAASLVLYVLIGACWLPVVWLQLKMRDLAVAAVAQGQELPALYWHYARRWEILGYPAFFMGLVIFWLMIAKPDSFAAM